MTRSPLRYPGGKSRAIQQIAPLIPHFEEYREPFLGGGSVFFHLVQHYPHKKYWINDLYFELYTFWNECKNDVEAVIRQIQGWKNEYPNGKELHSYLKSMIQTLTGVELAAAFFIFNRITFSGTSEAGGYSQAAFTGRFTRSSIDRLIPSAQLLQQATLTNNDYETLLSSPGNEVFIFLDPPYYSATASALYGKNGRLHKEFDHFRFADAVKNCPHRWLITYDDSPYIRRLFSFANIVPWNLTYGMRNITEHSTQKGDELFIANFDLNSNLARKQQQLFEVL